jgi:hypothetical protein
VFLVGAVPLVVTLLAGCGGGSGTLTVSGTAGPAGVGPSATASSSAVPTDSTAVTKSGGGVVPVATSSAHAGSAKGCPAGGAAIPKGAGKARTADLDGDGKRDTLWLADVGSRRILGVRTASGAGFSVTFANAAPESADAVANTLYYGTAVILLDTGRSVELYAVTGCRIVQSLNPQGQQYTFDKGFTGFGSGVGCPAFGSGRHLAGYLAVGGPKGAPFKVTRTLVGLADAGRRATNGAKTTLGTGLPANSPIVRQAQDVTCGTTGRALEPHA